MNLFELFVKIGVDDQASGNIRKITNGLGNGLKSAAKVGTAAVATAAAGITALTKVAVSSFAEYEQLVGGAQLMFNGAYDTVMKNAQSAYKTVQMSQIEYLKQVNGFATGLKTSLGGNEEAAASLAHEIVKAQADIVAATGNTQENVQNAFNGIMKGNFTMLDNLQIGITPTKEGYQEVIDKVNAWNEANGKATNYQMGNLADMQSALIDYIKMQGYSGYASREASQTVSGSISSMKAAWSNLVAGMADKNADIEKLVGNFVDTITGYVDESGNRVNGVFDNVFPVIEKTLSGVPKLIKSLAPKIIKVFPTLVKNIVPTLISASAEMVNSVVAIFPDLMNTVVDALIQNAPALITAAIGMVESLIQGIRDNYQILIDGAIQIVGQLAGGILGMLPEIVALGLDLIVSLADGITENTDELIPAIFDVVGEIVSMIIKNAPRLAEAAFGIIDELGNSLAEQIPGLSWVFENLETAVIGVTAAMVAYKAAMGIASLIDGVKTAILALKTATEGQTLAQTLLNAAMKANPIVLIVSLIAGLVAAIITLWNTNEGFRNAIISAWEAIKGAAETIFNAVANFFTETIPNAFNSVIDWFKNVGKMFADIGKNIIDGLKNGISNAWNNLVEWFKGLFGDLIGIAKKILGIASPSKVFKKLGSFTADGFGIGFEDEFAHVKDDMEDALNFDGSSFWVNSPVRKSASMFPGVAYSGATAGGITINQYIQSVPQTPVELSATTEAYFEQARWML